MDMRLTSPFVSMKRTTWPFAASEHFGERSREMMKGAFEGGVEAVGRLAHERPPPGASAGCFTSNHANTCSRSAVTRVNNSSASAVEVPPASSYGTSKWNKVEHRLFSFISSNWRGEPLRDYETIVRLIAKTTTAKGLTVTCRLDRRRYPVGHKVSDAEIATVRLTPGDFHGEWNYTIRPRTSL